MIAQFFGRATRWAQLRRRLWRFTYNAAARQFQTPEWTCMNYGYAPAAGEPSPAFRPEWAAERFPLQLYRAVASGRVVEGTRLLEVGCGRGGGLAYLAEEGRVAGALGIDFAAANVAFCRQRHRVAGLQFEVGDAEALPLPAESFDTVINVESSHCYGSFPRFVAEVRRVLVPGGRFCYADFRDQPQVSQWHRDLENSGLEIELREDISAAVARALEADGPRRRDFIQQNVPFWLRAAASEFAGVPGGIIHRELQSGALVYQRFVLRRPVGR